MSKFIFTYLGENIEIFSAYKIPELLMESKSKLLLLLLSHFSRVRLCATP